jgi:hypothetical protein
LLAHSTSADRQRGFTQEGVIDLQAYKNETPSEETQQKRESPSRTQRQREAIISDVGTVTAARAAAQADRQGLREGVCLELSSLRPNLVGAVS